MATRKERDVIIYHGRFQPFHRGHEAALKHIFSNHEDPVVVGIIQPDPANVLEGDDTHWPRFTPERNPFSYWTRYQFIARTFADEIRRGRLAGIVPLPRPSVNLERAASFIPQPPRRFAVFDNSKDEIEVWKRRAYLRSGERTLDILTTSIPNEVLGITGSLVRALMVCRPSVWDRLVPEAVAEVIGDDDLLAVVRGRPSRADALAHLRAVATSDSRVWSTARHFQLGLDRIAAPKEPARRGRVSLAIRPRVKERFVLLHISDLHIGQGPVGYRWDEERVLTALTADASALQDRTNASIRAIVVGGDISFSGDPSQFARAAEWLTTLASALGLSERSVFVVPGNHDVDRAISAELERLHDEARRNIDEVLASDRRRGLLLSKLSAFNAFADRLGRPNQATQWPSHHEPFWSHLFSDWTDCDIQLVGLNSCLTSDHRDSVGGLWVGQEQLTRLLGAKVAGDSVRVLISHHPASWLGDRARVEAATRGGCHLWLSGHVHEADYEESRSLASGDIVKIGASAGRGSEGERHGYNLVVLSREDRGSSLRIALYPRRWRPRKMDFVADNDFDLKKGTEFCERVLRLGGGT